MLSNYLSMIKPKQNGQFPPMKTQQLAELRSFRQITFRGLGQSFYDKVFSDLFMSQLTQSPRSQVIRE